MDDTGRRDRVRAHDAEHWGKPVAALSRRGNMRDLDPGFAIEVRHPSKRRALWTYSTVGMSVDRCRGAIEAHLFSRAQCDEASVFWLTMLAYFHLTGEKLGLEQLFERGPLAYDDPFRAGLC